MSLLGNANASRVQCDYYESSEEKRIGGLNCLQISDLASAFSNNPSAFPDVELEESSTSIDLEAGFTDQYMMEDLNEEEEEDNFSVLIEFPMDNKFSQPTVTSPLHFQHRKDPSMYSADIARTLFDHQLEFQEVTGIDILKQNPITKDQNTTEAEENDQDLADLTGKAEMLQRFRSVTTEDIETLIEYCGWLKKKTELNNEWKRRWMILEKGGPLVYYEDCKCIRLVGVIYLVNARLLHSIARNGITDTLGFNIRVNERDFVLRAPSIKLKEKWCDCIARNIVYSASCNAEKFTSGSFLLSNTETGESFLPFHCKIMPENSSLTNEKYQLYDDIQQNFCSQMNKSVFQPVNNLESSFREDRSTTLYCSEPEPLQDDGASNEFASD